MTALPAVGLADELDALGIVGSDLEGDFHFLLGLEKAFLQHGDLLEAPRGRRGSLKL